MSVQSMASEKVGLTAHNKAYETCEKCQLCEDAKNARKTIYTWSPLYRGALCNDNHLPFIIPEVPIPATARSTINIFEDVATAHIMEPSSKMAKKLRKVHCMQRLNDYVLDGER